jgi:F-type H+-transporting ATPase subunit delta
MNQSKIGVRYSKALFSLALEKGLLNELKNDIQLVALACDEANFQRLLESPVVKTSQKKALFTKIFSGKVNPLTIKFLLMLADNRREASLEGISRDFIQMYREHSGIQAAKVTTAVPLDKETKELINQLIVKLFKTQVELFTEENPALKGGFILRVGDQQIDASVNTKINQIKRKLIDTSI